MAPDDAHRAGPGSTPSAGRLALVLVLGILGGGANPSSARAYEDQITLGVNVGYGAAPETDLPKHGIVGALSGSLGLSDVFTLRAHAGYGFHPGDTALHVFMGGVELLYLVDVLSLVPYFGLGVDGLASLVDGLLGGDPAVHAVGGLDYHLSREHLIGLDIRAFVLPFALGDAGLDPVYLTVTARFTLLFDNY